MAHIPTPGQCVSFWRQCTECTDLSGVRGWVGVDIPSANKNSQTLPYQTPKILYGVSHGRVLHTEYSTSRGVQLYQQLNKIKICSCPDGITGLGLMCRGSEEHTHA